MYLKIELMFRVLFFIGELPAWNIPFRNTLFRKVLLGRLGNRSAAAATHVLRGRRLAINNGGGTCPAGLGARADCQRLETGQSRYG
jgi:hypothetical protein